VIKALKARLQGLWANADILSFSSFLPPTFPRTESPCPVIPLSIDAFFCQMIFKTDPKYGDALFTPLY